MTCATSRMTDRLARMAELRAAGLCWSAVAAELRVRAETCRQWVRDHARAWESLRAKAERDVWLEVLAEARQVLRNQLRSDDPAVVIAAAKVLLAECRRSLEVDAAKAPPVPPRAPAAGARSVTAFCIKRRKSLFRLRPSAGSG